MIQKLIYFNRKVKDKCSVDVEEEHCEKLPYFGVVYVPFTDTLYSAVKGKDEYKKNEMLEQAIQDMK